MGILNNILGNATEVNLNELQKEFTPLLADNEQLECAFRIFRDKWVFTNKRLIMLNVQGITGSKREYHSIPYKSIAHFAIETGGTFDDDCEMKIWISGQSEPFLQEFKKGTDLKSIQKLLAKHIFQ